MKPPKPQPRLSDLDEQLIRMTREQARTENPNDGFVSAMRHDEETGDRNGLLIYAWGPTAEVLARNLNLAPVRPFGGPLGISASDQAPAPTVQYLPAAPAARRIAAAGEIIDAEEE